ncbi:MAG: carboxylesterase family protein, partial [Muribaculaceae bacterium]|nr:carboxylesterase family protein [Muribaculaceae bacterium]
LLSFIDGNGLILLSLQTYMYHKQFIMKFRFLFLVAWIVFGAFSCPGASTFVTDFDIPFSQKQDSLSRHRLKLDIHHSNEGNDLPVIIWFHGGGLTSGNKFILSELMDRIFSYGKPTAYSQKQKNKKPVCTMVQTGSCFYCVFLPHGRHGLVLG